MMDRYIPAKLFLQDGIIPAIGFPLSGIIDEMHIGKSDNRTDSIENSLMATTDQRPGVKRQDEQKAVLTHTLLLIIWKKQLIRAFTFSNRMKRETMHFDKPFLKEE